MCGLTLHIQGTVPGTLHHLSHQYSAELGRLVSLSAQAADINALFGFRLECIERMGDPQGIWAWTRLNALFNWLPLAALIEDRIVCMHGGAPDCFASAR